MVIENLKELHTNYLNVVENKSESSQRFGGYLGKIGLVIMTVGLIILYYDAYVLIQLFPTGYLFFDHPQVHVPIIGMLIAFGGTSVFIYNFSKGKKVV